MNKFRVVLLVFCCWLSASAVAGPGLKFSVSGKVDRVDLSAGKIVVAGQHFYLKRDAIVLDRYWMGEIPPEVEAGDRVGLVFYTTSLRSSVKQVWILKKGRSQ